MRRALAALLLLTTPLTGCYSWAEHDPPAPARDRIPETLFKVRLHRTDGATTELYDAVVRPDSVVGLSRNPDRRKDARRIAVAREDVDRIEARRFSPGKTLLAVVGIPAAAIAVFGLICAARDCFGYGGFFGRTGAGPFDR